MGLSMIKIFRNTIKDMFVICRRRRMALKLNKRDNERFYQKVKKERKIKERV